MYSHVIVQKVLGEYVLAAWTLRKQLFELFKTYLLCVNQGQEESYEEILRSFRFIPISWETYVDLRAHKMRRIGIVYELVEFKDVMSQLFEDNMFLFSSPVVDGQDEGCPRYILRAANRLFDSIIEEQSRRSGSSISRVAEFEFRDVFSEPITLPAETVEIGGEMPRNSYVDLREAFRQEASEFLKEP